MGGWGGMVACSRGQVSGGGDASGDRVEDGAAAEDLVLEVIYYTG